MTQHLVANVRLRCVEGLRMMPYVLRRMENFYSQGIEKMSGRQKASDRTDRPSHPFSEVLRYRVQLRNRIALDDPISTEELECVEKFRTRVLAPHILYPVVHQLPRIRFPLCILYAGQLLPVPVGSCLCCDKLSPLSVNLIPEAWMVRIELFAKLQGISGDSIQILRPSGEPGHLCQRVRAGAPSQPLQGLVYGSARIRSKFDVKLHPFFPGTLRWSGLNSCHVYPV
mmetsp:Transcript_11495/g.35101  ORF Transcript_11495/g.35101 Transcript_11495/m.35101 type:complete len:227 (+) Transcript_11495:1688-2368(+)